MTTKNRDALRLAASLGCWELSGPQSSDIEDFYHRNTHDHRGTVTVRVTFDTLGRVRTALRMRLYPGGPFFATCVGHTEKEKTSQVAEWLLSRV